MAPMDIAANDDIGARWAALRERAWEAGLTAVEIGRVAGVPVRTVNDMLQLDWTTRTLDNITRVERAILRVLDEKEAPARASGRGES